MTKLDKLLQQQRFHKITPWVANGGRLLDIGCHNGEMLLHFSDKIKGGVGIDPLTTSTWLTPHLQLIKGNFPADITAADRFDTITALAVVEHISIQDQPKFFAACRLLLRPTGKLLLTIPSPKVDEILKWLKRFHLAQGMSSEQHYGYDIRKTQPLAEAAGLRLIKHQRFQFGLNNLFVFAPQ